MNAMAQKISHWIDDMIAEDRPVDANELVELSSLSLEQICSILDEKLEAETIPEWVERKMMTFHHRKGKPSPVPIEEFV